MRLFQSRIFRSLIAVGLILLALHACSGKSNEYFREHAVKLESAEGMCSGEQVKAPSGENYILTAAHCKGIAKDGSMKVILENGKSLQRKIVAEDANSDLLLLEGVPALQGLEIADYALMHEHVRTYTHGARMDTYRSDGEIIMQEEVKIIAFLITSDAEQDRCNAQPKYKSMDMMTFFGPISACVIDIVEYATTASITHGSSGGMVVDDNDKLVGIVSAGNDETHMGYLVTLTDIKAFLAGY